MYRKKVFSVKLVLAFCIIILLVFLSFKAVLVSDSSKARATVEKFYQFEQTGNFSDSWNLFHPFMKQKFTKASFIQDRAHVFIGHFGADSFKFEISDSKEVNGWKAATGEKPFKTVYRFEVKQIYSGKYGKFKFIQEVYVVRHKNDWLILWDYNS